ncbi:MAG: DUF58 domain-containing protein [Acidobacteria bacterium]|nr:DUF58 domain-containing protein [Acidobacteriota bacterium]
MIPADLVANLDYIELLTKKRMRNVLVGNHDSMLKGHGFDFAEHRAYVPGDELRRVDWNVFARTGEMHVKLTHEEREIDVQIVVDLSRSMDLASARRSKRELVFYVAATVAYSALADGIAVGLLGFTDRIELDVPTCGTKAHLWKLLDALWTARPSSKATDVASVLRRLRERRRRLSMIFFVSDFIFATEVLELAHFKAIVAQHDVIPIVVSDPLEARLPAGQGVVRLRDLESGRDRLVRLGRSSRASYDQWVRDRDRALLDVFYRLNLDFVRVSTDQPFRDLISTLFLTRKRQ